MLFEWNWKNYFVFLISLFFQDPSDESFVSFRDVIFNDRSSEFPNQSGHDLFDKRSMFVSDDLVRVENAVENVDQISSQFTLLNDSHVFLRESDMRV